MHKKEELLKRCTEILSKELPVLRKIKQFNVKRNLGDIIGVEPTDGYQYREWKK